MDYIEDYRLIKCLREGLPTDMNVYDAAALSAVVQLSERMRAAATLSTFLTSHAAAGVRLNRWVSFARSSAGRDISRLGPRAPLSHVVRLEHSRQKAGRREGTLLECEVIPRQEDICREGLPAPRG